MHEVGHTLGLRHNFRGSAGASAAQLANRGWTASHGFGVSVMDYSPPALALDPARQGDYYAPTIGSYDRWAITYGYADVVPGGSVARACQGRRARPPSAWTPEVEINGLRRDRVAGGRPGPPLRHRRGRRLRRARDSTPPSSRYDQTDDPLDWARDRVALIDGLFDSLETRVVAPGQSYGRLRSAFTDLLNDRWYALLVTTKYLGGATTSRDHRGDPGARPAVVNVPAAQQRAALAFLSDAGVRRAGLPVLARAAEPARGRALDALGRLARRRWTSRLPGSRLGAGPAGLAPRTAARSRGAGPGARCRPPRRTRRADGRAARAVLTLTGAIWAEIGAGAKTRPVNPRNITSVRRDVQRLYLNALIQMAVSPAAGTPEDARALARATLVGLGADIDRALAVPRPDLDAYTRAHLADARERIARALDAQMIQTTTGSR